jgi:pyruvate formate lyase activating enzyme
MEGRVHSFETLGALDGPGIRFVAFLQGCDLRCLYCHNPDTWDPQGGAAYTAAEVFARLKRYRPYFGASGGLTVSGGEPLLQVPFVTELFSMCRQNGIRTCLDTSGQPLGAWTEKLLSFTDLCLLDIKAPAEDGYRQICGMSLRTPLSFLDLLEKKAIATWIRQVIVPGFNDNAESIGALNKLLKPFSCVQKVELLPFDNLCLEKYDRMGIEFPLKETKPMEESKARDLLTLLDKRYA